MMGADTRRLLIVDDDETFREVVARAMTRRGYAVRTAGDFDSALRAAAGLPPSHALVDLRMPGPSGLKLIPALKETAPDVRIVVLTGYASIATAVEAIKLGAVQYLAKPVDASEIDTAFGHTPGERDLEAHAAPLSVERLEWEHIQKVLVENEGNVSATSRALGMHRRTLQRKLAKRPRAR
jgi:two-component system response regulator RegA